nr:transforming growth factor beta receptor type 3-like isoform X2 [Paramormyrops kingsleyae]
MAGKDVASVLFFAHCYFTSAGPLSSMACEILPVKDAHPVQAQWLSFSTLSGCASRETIGLPQEVHLITLRHRSPEEPTEPTDVILHVKPIQSLLIHQKPLIFVLSSPWPVMWKLRAENLAPHVKRTLHISKRSEVLFEVGNFSAFSNVLAENLPRGKQRLVTWAKRKYKAVTSFSEIKAAKNIYMKVGEDSMSSETCKIVKKFRSQNCLTGYLQTSKGCVLPYRAHNHEIHIIILQAPDPNSTFQKDVTVDIKVLDKDKLTHHDVVLILKCEKPVHWVIRSRGIMSKLKILTPDSVTLDSDTETLISKISRQDVPSLPQLLMQWAEEHNYSPVTSFTSTEVANHFTLWLRELDEVADPLKSTLSPQLAVLHRYEPYPSSAPQHRVPHLFLPASVKERPWPAVDHEAAFRVGLSVLCEEHRMVVIMDKEGLQANGYSKVKLTLQDPDCNAKSNATHYILETLLTGCQTTKYPFFPSPVVIYFNTILIGQLQPEGGSGWPFDYEDITTEPMEPIFSILFNCTYRNNKGPLAPFPSHGRHKDPMNNITFNMELYNTDLFYYTLPQPFLTISENKPIFVEVSATKSDHELEFMIQTCFISPNSNPNIASEYTLIENICPTDDSVRYYPRQLEFPFLHAQTDRKRFSFNFRSKFNMSLLFLHCEMSLCTKRQSSHGLPKCIQPDEACTSVNMDVIMAVMTPSTKTSTRPLVVLSDNKPQEPSGPSTRTFLQAPLQSNKEYIMYVLDTPVMVGITFAAFIIGAILTAALWFIYSRTGFLRPGGTPHENGNLWDLELPTRGVTPGQGGQRRD